MRNSGFPSFHKTARRAVRFVVAVALTVYGVASQAQYIAVDLQPTDGSLVSTRVEGAGGAQQAGYGFSPHDLSDYRALMWAGDASTLVDMHPSSLLDYPSLNARGRSMILATDGLTQGGYGSGVPTSQHDFAIRWSGTAQSAEFLFAPFQTLGSRVNGVGDGQQVGYGKPAIFVSGSRGSVKMIAGSAHALLWTTGSSTAVDLHNGADTTVAMACAGGKQVGYGAKTDAFGNVTGQKAMMWFGNRNSFIWLYPGSGFATSEALGISGNQQIGFGVVDSRTVPANSHALLWTGTAASVLDLHPAGLSQSYALSVCNGQQVGYALDAGNVAHALLWTGSSSSAVDLNHFLPAGFTGAAATAIDGSGRISGYGSAADGTHALIWVPAL